MRFHQVRRREFLAVLFGLMAWPLPARAQEPEKVARIGFLGASSAGDGRPTLRLIQNDSGLPQGRTLCFRDKLGCVSVFMETP
jgi:hypothetical protein